jgi:hypothetical protein
MTKKFIKLAPGPQLGYVVVFSTSDWEQVERAYGQTLPDRARNLVSIATLFLTLSLPLETNAPRIGGNNSDVLDDIERLIDQAEALRTKLYPPHFWSEEYHRSEITRGLDTRLMMQFDLIAYEPQNESSILRICLTGLIESGFKVVRRARDLEGVKREGDAWNAWIVWITLIAEAFKLPPGIRREVYRATKPGKPQPTAPPFVKLIKALQTIACPDYRKSSTDGGLAKAIARARLADKAPQDIYVGGSVETDALERQLLDVYGIRDYSQLNARDLLPLKQAVKMVIEGTRPGTHPFVPEAP